MSVQYEETITFAPPPRPPHDGLVLGGLTLIFSKGRALLHVFHDKGDFDTLEVSEDDIREIQCSLERLGELVREQRYQSLGKGILAPVVVEGDFLGEL